MDPADTEAILQRVRALSEAFVHVDVIAEQVGLRLARPSVRVELEHVDGKPVIHNYGHGGRGYTLLLGLRARRRGACPRVLSCVRRQALAVIHFEGSWSA